MFTLLFPILVSFFFHFFFICLRHIFISFISFFIFFLFLVLFRAVDETLYQLSASKVALKQLQSQKLPTQASKAPLKGGIFDPESGGSNTPGPGGNNWPRTKGRSRAGSFGQQVILFFLLFFYFHYLTLREYVFFPYLNIFAVSIL